MPSRRRFVATAGAAVAVLAGCTGGRNPDGDAPRDGGAEDGEPTRTGDGTPTADSPTTTSPDGTAKQTSTPEPGAWTPAWSLDADVEHVLSLTRTPSGLYATVSTGEDRSGVAALDPATEQFDWQTEFDGDAGNAAHLGQSNARDQWPLTVTSEALYAVSGERYTWSALHALDPASGEKRWSFERERELAVGGVGSDTVIAGGREFFEPEHTHDTPEEPLTTVVYGIDTATGAERWRRKFTDLRAATTGHGGVFVATSDRLTALSLDGTERWHADSSPARALLQTDTGVVLAAEDGHGGSTLRAFDPDGTDAWQHAFAVDSFLPHGDSLYALGDVTVALAADGTVQWQDDAYGTWPLLSPDQDVLYTRSGAAADVVAAYSLPDGTRRFRYDTPSNNGWPAGATDDVVVAEAITPEKAEFTSLYAVDDSSGRASAVYRPGDTVFSVAGTGDAVYAAIGDQIHAFDESP